MASILDRYGIKEVADVTFYKIKNDGTRGDPVLYLDTLKVSTIEQTAETVDARGGKGNPKLVIVIELKQRKDWELLLKKLQFQFVVWVLD